MTTYTEATNLLSNTDTGAELLEALDYLVLDEQQEWVAIAEGDR